jgi:nucleoside phosphorylase
MKPDHPFSTTLFITALKQESSVLQQLVFCDLIRSDTNLNEFSEKGQKIYLLEVGIGNKNFGGNLKPIIKKIRPDIIINYGICGILDPEKRILQNYLIDKICPMAGQPIELPQNSLWKILERSHHFTTGRLLTNSIPVLMASIRQQLMKASVCELVDMEAYHIAKIALILQIPVIVFKCSTDFADENTIKTVKSSVDSWQRVLREGLALILQQLIPRNL